MKYTTYNVQQIVREGRKGKPWQARAKYKDTNGKWKEVSKMLPEAKGKKEAMRMAKEWFEKLNAEADLMPNAGKAKTVDEIYKEYLQHQVSTGEIERSTYSNSLYSYNKELSGSIDQIFNDINSYIFAREKVDTDHVYIDGTKIEANANKYTWVWKKSCIKSRNKVFERLTSLISEMNEAMAVYRRATFDARQEYEIEYVDFILASYLKAVGMTEADFVHGKGKRGS